MKLIAQLLIAAAAASTFSVLAAETKPEPAAKAEAAPAKVAKPDLVKGEASYGAVCAACHGADGNSGTPAYPKLAQQHPEYLVKQLQEFKSGKRNNAVMKGFATALTDDDMKNIAFWVASKKAKPGFANDKELVTLGERPLRTNWLIVGTTSPWKNCTVTAVIDDEHSGLNRRVERHEFNWTCPVKRVSG